MDNPLLKGERYTVSKEYDGFLERAATQCVAPASGSPPSGIGPLESTGSALTPLEGAAKAGRFDADGIGSILEAHPSP